MLRTSLLRTSFVFTVLVLSGCASGQAGANVATTDSVNFPVPDAATTVASQTVHTQTTEADSTIDLSGEISSMGKLGAIGLETWQNTVDGADLSFIDHLGVTIATVDGSMPARPLADAAVAANSSSADLPPLLSDSDLLSYLVEGPVVLHFTASGKLPPRPLALTHQIAVQVTMKVSGSATSL